MLFVDLGCCWVSGRKVAVDGSGGADVDASVVRGNRVLFVGVYELLNKCQVLFDLGQAQLTSHCQNADVDLACLAALKMLLDHVSLIIR